MLILTFSLAQAQDDAGTKNPTINWNVSEKACLRGDGCLGSVSVNLKNVLYGFIRETKTLYVVQPDGSPPVKVDLSLPAQNAITSLTGDFVPFEDDTIVFAGESGIGPNVNPGFQLYLYDLLTGHLTPLPVKWPGRLTRCERQILVNEHQFYRIGTGKRIVACTQTNRGVYQINIVNLETYEIERTLLTYQTEPDLRPWAKLVGGLDGNLYVQFYFQVVYNAADGRIRTITSSNSSEAETLFYIFRYAPDTQAWENIAIPKRALAEADPSWSKLIGVDKQGNQYWEVDIRGRFGYLKFSPQGNLIWHLPGNQIVDKVFYQMLGNDEFLAWDIKEPFGLSVFQVQPGMVTTPASPIATGTPQS
jgi:hypothetical protein